MTGRKITIVALVLLIAALAFSVGGYIIVASNLFAAYYPKEFFISPVQKYYWLFVFAIFIAVIYGFWEARKLWHSENGLRPLYLTNCIIALMFSLYLFGYSWKLDIPYSYKLKGIWYDIPWSYHPGGRSNSRGSYLRVAATYPGFSEPIALQQRKNTDGFHLRLSKQTSPDILCFGDIGCHSKVDEERSDLPTSVQLLAKIESNMEVRKDTSSLQATTRKEGDTSTTYFFQYDPTTRMPKTYGFCTGLPSYLKCNYLIINGREYFNVSVGTNNQSAAASWQLDRDLNAIETGTIKLFESFIRHSD